MDPWIAIIIVVLLALAFYLWPRLSNSERIQLAKAWSRLHEEILKASLEVSRHCPQNEEAHADLIKAAGCLVYPGNGWRASAKDLRERLEEGHSVLKDLRVELNLAALAGK